MIDSMYVEVGAAIRKRREAAGMTQAALGDHLSLSRTSITNMERGRQPILLHQLFKAAHALGVEATDLMPKINRDQSDVRPTEEFEELLAKLTSNRSGSQL